MVRKGDREMRNTTEKQPRMLVLGRINVIVGVLAMLAAFDPGHSATALPSFIGGMISAVIGVGLLKLQPWARIAAIVAYAFNILVGFVSFNLIAVVVSSAILTYLCSAKVKAVFAPKDAPYLQAPLDSAEPHV